MQAMVCVSLFVCANHFTSDCLVTRVEQLTDGAHLHLKVQAQKQPALSRATFRQLKFSTMDGFGAMHIEYSVVGPLTAV